MFILQSHKEILTNEMYHDCKEANEYRFPVSFQHTLYLKDLPFLVTLENNVPVHVQPLTCIGDIFYIYVDRVTPGVLSSLRMLLNGYINIHKFNYQVVCKPEGRDVSIPALYYGFTIPKELSTMEHLTTVMSEKIAKTQLDTIASLKEGQELVMQWSPKEDLVDYFVDAGFNFANVTYQL